MQGHTYLRTHTLKAERLLLDLQEAANDLRSTTPEHDRRAVTLIHESGLNVTITFLASGAELHEHAASGPVTIQVLSGRAEFRFGDELIHAAAGQLVAFDAKVRHAVHAEEDTTLLLTVSEPVVSRSS